MQVLIRKAVPDDLAAISAIYEESVLNGIGTYEIEPPGFDEMAARYTSITNAGFPYLVAVAAGGEILGYAYASPFRTRAAYDWFCEDSIYVDPAARGRKVGKLLLDALVTETSARGYRQMVAVIGGANPASIALHAAAGFRECGRLEGSGFKHGQWLDTVIMQLPLGDGALTLPKARPAGSGAV